MIQNPEALLVLGCGIDESGELTDDARTKKALKDLLDGTKDGDVNAIYEVMRAKHPGYRSDPVVRHLGMDPKQSK